MPKIFVSTVLAVLLFLSAQVSAQHWHGTVHGVYPEGVLLHQPGGAILVPSQHATFEIGGLRMSLSNIQPGQVVHAYVPQAHMPRVVRVQDPYDWHMRHYPQRHFWVPPGHRYGHPGKGKGPKHHRPPGHQPRGRW